MSRWGKIVGGDIVPLTRKVELRKPGACVPLYFDRARYAVAMEAFRQESMKYSNQMHALDEGYLRDHDMGYCDYQHPHIEDFLHDHAPELETMDVHFIDPAARLPCCSTPQAAGADLYCCENYVISPQSQCLLRTGLQISLPVGTYGRIAARSGPAFHGDLLVNAGVVDADYAGEIKILVYNMSVTKPLTISNGESVAQLICERYTRPHIRLHPMNLQSRLPATSRQEGFQNKAIM